MPTKPKDDTTLPTPRGLRGADFAERQAELGREAGREAAAREVAAAPPADSTPPPEPETPSLFDGLAGAYAGHDDATTSLARSVAGFLRRTSETYDGLEELAAAIGADDLHALRRAVAFAALHHEVDVVGMKISAASTAKGW